MDEDTCFFCGAGCTEDDFCFGCHEHVCEQCHQNDELRPSHLVGDHRGAADGEAE